MPGLIHVWTKSSCKELEGRGLIELDYANTNEINNDIHLASTQCLGYDIDYSFNLTINL